MSQGLKKGTLLDHGNYRVEKILRQGGFGITYLVTDLNLNTLRAVKEFFPKEYCDRDGSSTTYMRVGVSSVYETVNRYKEKFLKEARNIAKFDHPNIIRIQNAFEENHTAYYVMDYIEGESLSELVKRRGPIGKDRALRYIEEIGRALEYVHAHRINHLDVKPANIMIRERDDSAILIDFGLSKQYDSEGNQTSTTPMGISHGFAPVEQYNPGGVSEFSPETDVYSLAATLYYILSGQIPPTPSEISDNGLSFPPGFPQELEGPIRKAMSKRSERPKSTVEFINALKNSAGNKGGNGTRSCGFAIGIIAIIAIGFIFFPKNTNSSYTTGDTINTNDTVVKIAPMTVPAEKPAEETKTDEDNVKKDPADLTINSVCEWNSETRMMLIYLPDDMKNKLESLGFRQTSHYLSDQGIDVCSDEHYKEYTTVYKRNSNGLDTEVSYKVMHLSGGISDVSLSIQFPNSSQKDNFVKSALNNHFSRKSGKYISISEEYNYICTDFTVSGNKINMRSFTEC